MNSIVEEALPGKIWVFRREEGKAGKF